MTDGETLSNGPAPEPNPAPFEYPQGASPAPVEELQDASNQRQAEGTRSLDEGTRSLDEGTRSLPDEPQAAPPRVSLGERLRRNPVVLKEFRSRMRGRRAFVILTIYTLLLGLAVMGVYFVFLRASGTSDSVRDRQTFGKIIFALVVWLELTAISFIAPALTAGAITAERDHQTYDLLRVTLLPARWLVLGKFMAALGFILLLLLAAVPVQSLAFLFGGVTLTELAIASLMLIFTAGIFCAAGVFFSSFMKRTLGASVLAYGYAILAQFGLPMLAIILVVTLNTIPGASNGLTNRPAVEMALLLTGWLLASTNPLATAAITEGFLIDQQSAFLVKVSLSGSTNPTLISPWLLYLAYGAVVMLIFLELSVHFVRRVEK